MACFIVEAYEPNPAESGSETMAALQRAADAVSTKEAPVRYLRSILVPADETCFHLFEASTAASVCEASREAKVACTRIAEAILDSNPGNDLLQSRSGRETNTPRGEGVR